MHLNVLVNFIKYITNFDLVIMVKLYKLYCRHLNVLVYFIKYITHFNLVTMVLCYYLVVLEKLQSNALHAFKCVGKLHKIFCRHLIVKVKLEGRFLMVVESVVVPTLAAQYTKVSLTLLSLQVYQVFF